MLEEYKIMWEEYKTGLDALFTMVIHIRINNSYILRDRLISLTYKSFY